MNLIESIISIVGALNVTENEPMKNHTTFKIGGNADVLADISSEEMLLKLIKFLKAEKIPYFVMGNGSNILVSDNGIRGVVIKIGNSFADCQTEGNEIIAKSGIKLSRLASLSLNSSLSGLEFASGIPGTLGGAVFMNAGAYGGEMKQVVSSVTYLDTDSLEYKTISKDECDFGYRHSIFSSGNKIVTEVKLCLSIGEKAQIKALMQELNQRRTEKQPLDKPSAGSTFKRPEGYFAGALISDAGLKGALVGGAMVSKKHSGFVINYDNAKASDVLELIELVRKTVFEKFGVMLEPEVLRVGEF